jgi:hypothetical protein
MLTRLQAQADAAGQLDWQVWVDSTVVRVHQHGDRAEVALGGDVAHRGATE